MSDINPIKTVPTEPAPQLCISIVEISNPKPNPPVAVPIDLGCTDIIFKEKNVSWVAIGAGSLAVVGLLAFFLSKPHRNRDYIAEFNARVAAPAAPTPNPVISDPIASPLPPAPPDHVVISPTRPSPHEPPQGGRTFHSKQSPARQYINFFSNDGSPQEAAIQAVRSQLRTRSANDSTSPRYATDLTLSAAANKTAVAQ